MLCILSGHRPRQSQVRPSKVKGQETPQRSTTPRKGANFRDVPPSGLLPDTADALNTRKLVTMANDQKLIVAPLSICGLQSRQKQVQLRRSLSGCWPGTNALETLGYKVFNTEVALQPFLTDSISMCRTGWTFRRVAFSSLRTVCFCTYLPGRHKRAPDRLCFRLHGESRRFTNVYSSNNLVQQAVLGLIILVGTLLDWSISGIRVTNSVCDPHGRIRPNQRANKSHGFCRLSLKTQV